MAGLGLSGIVGRKEDGAGFSFCLSSSFDSSNLHSSQGNQFHLLVDYTASLSASFFWLKN